MTGQPISCDPLTRKVASKYHVFVATRWENGPTSQGGTVHAGDQSAPCYQGQFDNIVLNFGYDTMTTGEKTQAWP